MQANVWQLCLDWNGDLPSTVAIDSIEPNAGTKGARRGGSWLNPAIVLYLVWSLESAPRYVYYYLASCVCLSKRK